MSYFLDSITTKENHERFVRRIIESETVWYLKNSDGVPSTGSNDDDETRILLMYWSDKAYAKRARDKYFEDYEVTSMTLFEFLYRWLPAMSEYEELAGTNWTRDLIGVEIDPYDLRTEIEDRLPASLKEKHLKLYEEHR